MDDYDIYYEYIIIFDGKTPNTSRLTPHWAYSYEEAQKIRQRYLDDYPNCGIWVRRTERTYDPWRQVDPINEPHPPRNGFTIIDSID